MNLINIFQTLSSVKTHDIQQLNQHENREYFAFSLCDRKIEMQTNDKLLLQLSYFALYRSKTKSCLIVKN